MISVTDANQLLNIMAEASAKLSFLIGEPVELSIVKPELPELNHTQKMMQQIEREEMQIRITQMVCDQYMISISQLTGKSRSGLLPDARKMATHFLAAYVEGIKDAEIGKLLNFDRTMAISNRMAATDRVKNDKLFRFHYQQILKRLKKHIQTND